MQREVGAAIDSGSDDDLLHFVGAVFSADGTGIHAGNAIDDCRRDLPSRFISLIHCVGDIIRVADILNYW